LVSKEVSNFSTVDIYYPILADELPVALRDREPSYASLIPVNAIKAAQKRA
jgi:hypothetical protein